MLEEPKRNGVFRGATSLTATTTFSAVLGWDEETRISTVASRFSCSIERRTRDKQSVKAEEDGLGHPPSPGHLPNTNTRYHSPEDLLVESYQSAHQVREYPRRRVNKVTTFENPFLPTTRTTRYKHSPGTWRSGLEGNGEHTYPLVDSSPPESSILLDYRCTRPNGKSVDLNMHPCSTIDSRTHHESSPPPGMEPSGAQMKKENLFNLIALSREDAKDRHHRGRTNHPAMTRVRR